MSADTKQEKKETALAALEATRHELEELEAKVHEVRERRNRLIYEAAHKHKATITEVANRANVAHSFASRTIRGKGKPGSGSRS